MEARIRRAKALVLDRRFSLIDVAVACGFSSHAHFSTVFKRHARTSPSAWRTLHQR
jgi:transcriptional regulator GlxA family with amidase domain